MKAAQLFGTKHRITALSCFRVCSRPSDVVIVAVVSVWWCYSSGTGSRSSSSRRSVAAARVVAGALVAEV